MELVHFYLGGYVMSVKTINTGDECLKCKFCTLDESDKARILVNCSLKKRKYNYGQRIICEDMEVTK